MAEANDVIVINEVPAGYREKEDNFRRQLPLQLSLANYSSTSWYHFNEFIDANRDLCEKVYVSWENGDFVYSRRHHKNHHNYNPIARPIPCEQVGNTFRNQLVLLRIRIGSNLPTYKDMKQLFSRFENAIVVEISMTTTFLTYEMLLALYGYMYPYAHLGSRRNPRNSIVKISCNVLVPLWFDFPMVSKLSIKSPISEIQFRSIVSSSTTLREFECVLSDLRLIIDHSFIYSWFSTHKALDCWIIRAVGQPLIPIEIVFTNEFSKARLLFITTHEFGLITMKYISEEHWRFALRQ